MKREFTRSPRPRLAETRSEISARPPPPSQSRPLVHSKPLLSVSKPLRFPLLRVQKPLERRDPAVSCVREQSAAESTFLSARGANPGLPLSRGWSREWGLPLISRDVKFQPFYSEAAHFPHRLGLYFKLESLMWSSSSPTTCCQVANHFSQPEWQCRVVGRAPHWVMGLRSGLRVPGSGVTPGD